MTYVAVPPLSEEQITQILAADDIFKLQAPRAHLIVPALNIFEARQSADKDWTTKVTLNVGDETFKKTTASMIVELNDTYYIDVLFSHHPNLG